MNEQRRDDERQREPGAEKLMIGLWLVHDACMEVLVTHSHDGRVCDCWLCDDAQGILWQTRMAEATIEGQLYRMPDEITRLCKEGFPSADRLAELLASDEPDEPKLIPMLAGTDARRA